MTPSVDELRAEAMRAGLSLHDAPSYPMQQFRAWFEQARAAGLYQPRAMSLATVNARGRPSARMVILAGFGDSGFDFTTDRRSPKALDLQRQPWAALVFYWAELERQVRVEGKVAGLAEATTDAYFQVRSRESRLATWASRQSEVIAGRDVLEEQLLRVMAEHEHAPVARPPDTFGFRLQPSLVEFWQARSDRLHDRVRYRRAEDETWIIELLSP
jgi:pyridoxamine 5'-phosphate oxidase